MLVCFRMKRKNQVKTPRKMWGIVPLKGKNIFNPKVII